MSAIVVMCLLITAIFVYHMHCYNHFILCDYLVAPPPQIYLDKLTMYNTFTMWQTSSNCKHAVCQATLIHNWVYPLQIQNHQAYLLILVSLYMRIHDHGSCQTLITYSLTYGSWSQPNHTFFLSLVVVLELLLLDIHPSNSGSTWWRWCRGCILWFYFPSKRERNTNCWTTSWYCHQGCSMFTSSTVEMRWTSDSLLSQPSIMSWDSTMVLDVFFPMEILQWP